ncbi:hypothetical protein LguiA_001540 [Lonicera macranthoides]
MKNSQILTPNSSVKSSTTGYFPGCRKCANCNCEMCLASLTATLDLMPMSIQRSSLTKISNSNQIPRTPLSFGSSPLSTPNSSPILRFNVSPPLNSRARVNFQRKVKRKKRELGFGFMMVRVILGVGLIFGVDFAVSWVVPRVLEPKLSSEVVRDLGGKSWVLQDWNERMVILSKEVNVLVGAKVSNGSSVNFIWEIIQDGLLLKSRCILYKSWLEELSVFGWPLQTSGLLTSEFSSQSFTILSGRVTQWSNSEIGHSIRRANSSWTQGKWSASIVHLDRNTWILEYKRSSIIENRRFFTSALEFLKLRITRKLQKMKKKFWLSLVFGNQYSSFKEDSSRVPT